MNVLRNLWSMNLAPTNVTLFAYRFNYFTQNKIHFLFIELKINLFFIKLALAHKHNRFYLQNYYIKSN